MWAAFLMSLPALVRYVGLSAGTSGCKAQSAKLL